MTERMQPTEAVRGAGRRRRELFDAITTVERAISAPAADPRWRSEVAREFAELGEAFSDHVDEVERPGGLFDEILDEAPRLDPQINWFKDDHRRLGARIRELAGRVEREDPSIMRDLVADLIHDLVRHRQRGADLVYEAYSVDLGGW